MKNYLFDVTLLTSLRVDADSEEDARRRLTEALHGATVNFGEIRGEPLIGNAEIEGELDLAEIDGEAV